jgi:Flp pilus assembly pilin Flp
MLTILMRLVGKDSGQDMAEYGIALAVIGVGAGLAAIAIAGNVSLLWSQASSVIGAVL